MEIIVLFILKMKFLPKTFTKMYKFCIKSVVLYKKCTFGAEKMEKMYFLHQKWSFCQKISHKCTNFA